MPKLPFCKYVMRGNSLKVDSLKNIEPTISTFYILCSLYYRSVYLTFIYDPKDFNSRSVLRLLQRDSFRSIYIETKYLYANKLYSLLVNKLIS